MLQSHLKINKIERYVLLPGDPGRIDKILNSLTDVKELNVNREFRSCNGKYKGINISMVSTGIGCPAAAIAVEELANIRAKVLIRIGTCGGLLEEMQPGDIVIPSAAMCFDGTAKEYKSGVKKIEADKKITESLIKTTEKLGVKYFTGINRTHDAFYEPTENFVKLAGQGLISSEMECSAVFMLSKLRNLKAGAILVVNTPEPPEEVEKDPSMVYRLVDKKKVQKGTDTAIKIALETIRILEKNNMNKKIIGILGGMGPESTAMFYQSVIQQCQKQYRAQYDEDYPEIFIYNLPIPDVVEGIKNPSRILPILIKGIRRLEYIGVDFIVIPCNTVQYFYNNLRKSISVPLLNIVEETAKKVKSKNYKRVGLLATITTIENKIYERVLTKFGIETIVTEEQNRVTKIILNILAGKKLESDKLELKKIIGKMEQSGAEAVILGCTDIPALLTQKDINIELFDSIEILAEATVKYAVSK